MKHDQEKIVISCRWMLWLALVCVSSLLGWAAFAEVDIVTRAEGTVMPSRQVQIVQNLEGGIVEDILVREGDVVEKDQIIMMIDDTRFTANLSENRLKIVSKAIEIQRLQAELDNKPFSIPHELRSEYPELAHSETSLYQARQNEFKAKLEILQQQRQQKQHELIETQTKQAQIQRNITLLKEEVAMFEELAPKGHVSKLRVNQAKRELNDELSSLENNQVSIPRIKLAIHEADNKIDEIHASYRTDAANELNDALAELSQLKTANNAVVDQVSRASVRSPVHGTIKKVHVNTIGGVVKPGMDLVEIVPIEDSLLVEAKVRPADVAFLHPGLNSTVKFTAYDFSTYGGLPARLEHISADTLKDKNDESYYLIRVRTDKNHIGNNQQLPIIPGMTTQVDIMTGKRTILDYILKPIIRAKQNALREA